MRKPGGGRGKSYPQMLPDLPGEEWRNAADYPGYSVSNKGRVRRDEGPWAGGILVQSPSTTAKWNRWQYACVRIQRVGKYKHVRVHRLVMATFVGPLPEGAEVNHIDGDHWNNTVTNLEYVTKQENEAHAVAIGHRPKGERHHAAKVTEAQVRYIRSSQKGHAELARELGVNDGIVEAIRQRKTWKHVA